MARPNKNYVSLPTVKFEQRHVTDSIKTDLRDNVESLNDIASTDRPMLYDAALRAILAGGDLYSLSQALIGLGITKRRSAEISCYLSNNATILMESERREQLGITHAIWRHSGVPCGEYAQDLAHRAADGKHFPVTEGLYIGGRFTLPGRDYGCQCWSTSVLVGCGDRGDLENQPRADEKNEQIQAERRWKIFRFFGFFQKKSKNKNIKNTV